MKTYLLIIFVLVLSSCDSGSDSAEDLALNVVNGSWMTANVDGNPWRNALEVTASILPVPGTETRIFLITAGGIGESILVAEGIFLSKVVPGAGETVNVDQEDTVIFATDSQVEEFTYAARGASVNIELTEITDTVVRGTFSGQLVEEDDMSRMISVTDGEFVANISG